MLLGWQVLELAQPNCSITKGSWYMHKALSIVKIIEPEVLKRIQAKPSFYFILET